jgi:hypothetical protein
MNCDEARSHLWAEREGELSAELRERLGAHRRVCATCRQATLDLGRLGRAFASASAVRAPARLEGRVRDLLRRVESRPPRPLFWRQTAAALAGIGLWLALACGWRAWATRHAREAPAPSPSSVARHLAGSIALLESGSSPGMRDPVLEARPELRLLTSLRAKKGS